MQEETKAISEVSVTKIIEEAISEVTKIIEEVDQKDVNIKVSFSVHSLFNISCSVYKILLFAGKYSKLVVTIVFKGLNF